jgi:hypothetical protein
MQFDGLQDGVTPLAEGTTEKQAMMSVLRPEQVQAYEEHRREQLEKAQQDAAEIGLTIPNDWNPDDDISF